MALTGKKLALIACMLGFAIPVCLASSCMVFSIHAISTESVSPAQLLRMRALFSALDIALSVGCVTAGFSILVLGLQRNFPLLTDFSRTECSLTVGFPSLVLILCGAALALAPFSNHVSIQFNSSAVAPQTEISKVAPSQADMTRTVASSPIKKIALYTTETAIYNDLMEIGDPGPYGGALRHLIENENDLSVVMIDWDAQLKRPLSYQARDLGRNDARILVSTGYLFVLESDNAETVKAVLKAANSVEGDFPKSLHFSDDSIAKIVRAGLKNKQRFTRGEPGR